MKMHSKENTHSVFTLIELLVMFAILAMLISLISPSYKKLAESSKQLQCKNMLKFYHLAHQLYANDHDGQTVPIWRTVPSGTSNPWQERFWIGNSNFLTYLDVEDTVLIPDDKKCPSLLETDSIWYHSYGINRDPTGWKIDNPMMIHKVSVPSSVIFMTEGTDFHLDRNFANYLLKWDIDGETRLWAVAYRHQEGANATFMDGHIEYRQKEEVYFPNDAQARQKLWEINRDAFLKP